MFVEISAVENSNITKNLLNTIQRDSRHGSVFAQTGLENRASDRDDQRNHHVSPIKERPYGRDRW